MTDPGGSPCGDRDQDSESRNQSDNVGFEILGVVRHRLPLLASPFVNIRLIAEATLNVPEMEIFQGNKLCD